MDQERNLVGELIARIGAGKVITDPLKLAAYRGLGWGVASSKLPLERPPQPPMAAVLAHDTEDVRIVIDFARATGVPIVPHGAGTGVQAGAAPVRGSILLDLAPMDHILDINREDRLARVQPGVVLGDLNRAVVPHGLMVGHDPWSQPIATVGGAVSTNGIGYLAGRYGPIGDQVRALEVVLGTGEIIRTRAVQKMSTGPELRRLFIGAEGIFGVITEVALTLFPLPESRAFAAYQFPRFEDCLEAIKALGDLGIRPAMIDAEEDAPERSELSLGALLDLRVPTYFTFDGFTEQVAAEKARTDQICRRCNGQALGEGIAQHFWDNRHHATERWLRQRVADPESLWSRRRPRSSSYVNIGLPTSTILEFRRRAANELAQYRLALHSAGFWGTPEMFSIRFEHIAPDDTAADAELDEGTDHGLRLAQELGGSMENCHGVGLRLAHLMEAEHGTAMSALRALKSSLDPCGILNPGKLAL